MTNGNDNVLLFFKEKFNEIKDLDEDSINRDIQIEELGLDSLDFVEIQVGVKKKFNISLSPELFEGQITTIGELCDYIQASQ